MSKTEIQKQMFAIVEECNQSGLSRRAYCQANNLNEARFYYWQKKSQMSTNPTGNFIKIDSQVSASKSNLIEVVYPNGVRLVTDISTSRNDLNKIVGCW